jgi:hypothetical protein
VTKLPKKGGFVTRRTEGRKAGDENECSGRRGCMKNILTLVRKSLLWIVLLPYAIFGLGAASNQLVLIANHDKFPVMVNLVKQTAYQDASGNLPDGMIDEVHCIMTKDTRLNFLADVFDMHDSIYSVGDGLLVAGESTKGYAFLVWAALLLYKEKQRLSQK